MSNKVHIISIYTHFSRDKNQFPRQQRRFSGPSLGLAWLATALSSLALPEPCTTGQGSWLAREGWGRKAEQGSWALIRPRNTIPEYSVTLWHTLAHICPVRSMAISWECCFGSCLLCTFCQTFLAMLTHLTYTLLAVFLS